MYYLISRLLAVFTVFMLLPLGSYAQGVPQDDIVYQADEEKIVVPGIGTDVIIPHDLNLPDHRGRMRSFDELRGKNGIVLYFVRSAVWCPYCVFQLRELSERGALIQDRGYNVVVLSYDSIRKLSIFVKENEFPYPVLSDKGSVVIQAFGLLNDEYKPGTTYYGVPHPAVYIIGNDGLILRKFYEPDIKNRTTVDEIYAAILELGDYRPLVEYNKDFDK